ncbi:hypothetical protein [Coraliomargarita akajimensis]|nr:hypothetical protein [Coraliomargarita akajimensis]
MPDHLHLIWIGAGTASDQLKATAFLRKYLSAALAPYSFQRQAHDHVLRENERRRDRLSDAVQYVRLNPERAGLVENWFDWPFTGALIPGYPDLGFGTELFWDRFWVSHTDFVEP